MAVPLYSTRVLEAHSGGGAVYTVPAGYRLVLRFLTAFNGSAFASEAAQLVLSTFSVTLWQVEVPASESAFLDCRIVINEGEELAANLGPDIDFTASGYLLSLP